MVAKTLIGFLNGRHRKGRLGFWLLDAVTKYCACSMGAISFHGKHLMIAMDV
jgi:hypothetical protein